MHDFPDPSILLRASVKITTPFLVLESLKSELQRSVFVVTKAELQSREVRNVLQGIQRSRGLKQTPVISVLVLAPVGLFHRWRPGVADLG